ncbi:MAG: 30S ribosomal protein S2 [bacterium]|nr:30S ribosomal protein S2 [bacterium]
MPTLPSLVDMLKSGVHLGHKKSKRHPKMDPYIFMNRGEMTVIDLEKTQELLGKALNFITSSVANGKIVLFVGTKRQAQDPIQKYALSCEMPYVNGRWIGGMLTNFAVISKMIKRYKTLKEQHETGALAKYTKKEQLDFARDIVELENAIGGISNLTKLPDIVFLLDIKRDKTAYTEAKKKHLPTVAVCDTNVNPTHVDYVIPANDDAVKSIDLLVSLVAQAVLEGKAQAMAQKVASTTNEESEKAPIVAETTKKADLTTSTTAEKETPTVVE